MIPVTRKSKPSDFDIKIKQKGDDWLRINSSSSHSMPPYWRDCLDDLHREYNGICAYLAVYIESGTGLPTVDHFIPKSLRSDLAYEWDNYRLACHMMNTRKREFSDVLDPFLIHQETFHLILYTGQIIPTAKSGTSDFDSQWLLTFL